MSTDEFGREAVTPWEGRIGDMLTAEERAELDRDLAQIAATVRPCWRGQS